MAAAIALGLIAAIGSLELLALVNWMLFSSFAGVEVSKSVKHFVLVILAPAASTLFASLLAFLLFRTPKMAPLSVLGVLIAALAMLAFQYGAELNMVTVLSCQVALIIGWLLAARWKTPRV